jgi:hypothetical protein
MGLQFNGTPGMAYPFMAKRETGHHNLMIKLGKYGVKKRTSDAKLGAPDRHYL